MSGFRSPQFVKEFAYRTMVNYYNFKNITPEKYTSTKDPLNMEDFMDEGSVPSPEQKVDTNLDERSRILQEMDSYGFDTSQQYEVTLAINSLLGLLVFPQQEYYQSTLNKTSYCNLPLLDSCLQSTEQLFRFRYKTYNKLSQKWEDEKNTPANILRHMRNAVCHDKVMIQPIANYGNQITHVRFIDAGYYQPFGTMIKTAPNVKISNTLDATIAREWSKPEFCLFDLMIPVNKLEGILMEVARFLINCPT